MTDNAKKIVELQRRIQQAFLMIQDYCNPKTFLSRMRAGNSTEFQLERMIESLSDEVTQVKQTGADKMDHTDIFANELKLLEQGSSRLNGIMNLLNVTKTLRRMKDKEEAKLLIKKAESDFNQMRNAYPFEKDDIEARTAHTVFCMFVGVVTTIDPIKPPLSGTPLPVQRAYQEKSRVERLCIEAETKARCVIDAVNPSLHITGEIEQHNMFSTEKCLEELKCVQKTDSSVKQEEDLINGPREWLSALKLEKCKVSVRARKLRDLLIELIELAAKHPTNHDIARSISAIIQMFTVRAQPNDHSGSDSAVFFNDCHYLVVEIERSKCKSVCNADIEKPIDAFNFGNLLNELRKSGRNTFIRDLIHIKSNYLTWSDDALAKYMKDCKDNEFQNVLEHLKRFISLWLDVCSKNAYVWIVFIVVSHVLNGLVSTLLKLKNFERSTCSHVLPLFNEIVDVCSGYIRACEVDLNKKFSETKPGHELVNKVANLKSEMINRGADPSLAELFDFKLVA